MKTKFSCLALVISAAVAAPVQGDDHHGGRNVAVASRESARSSAASVRSMPRGNFGGGRPIMSGQRFSSMGMPTGRSAFRQSFVNPNRAASIAPRLAPRTVDRGEALARFGGSQNRFGTSLATERADAARQLANINRGYVNPNSDASLAQRFASRTFNGSERLTRFSNSEARSARFENPNRDRFEQFTRRPLNRSEGLTRFSNSEARTARFENRNGNRSGQINGRRNVSTSSAHVFARRSANWHGDWDRDRDHWWNGHRCRFFGGSWIIFDVGFSPWWGWPFGYPSYGYYPYDYYPSDYYPSSSYNSYGYAPGGYDPGGYDPGAYDQNDGDYYGRGAYNSPDQYTDRTVADAQRQLAEDGYYRGEIDGILGPQTRRAIVSFQSGHGLRVTGNLSQETLSTLGL